MLNEYTLIVPLITCKFSSCQYVCECVFGVDVHDFNLGMQINSVKQTFKSNSVGPGHVSTCWTSALMMILITASLFSKILSIAPN